MVHRLNAVLFEDKADEVAGRAYLDQLAIDLADFQARQATLKACNPRAGPARVVTSPMLQTGLAACTTCCGPMMLYTDNSKSGRDHRYYSCSIHGHIGMTGCTGRSIPMKTLDTLVIDRPVAELFQPDRLPATLSSL